MNMFRNMSVAIVSGGFDPIHPGHISLINGASEIARHVIVLLNSDEWLVRKKGYNFMCYEDRRKVLMSIKGVGKVVKAYDHDDTVCESLRMMREFHALDTDIFFCNGGDRGSENTPEVNLCNEIGIELKYGVGGANKIESSSELVMNVLEQLKANDLLGVK